MSEEPTEKPKLIIDDDWKERVQSEKEAAAASSATNKDETPDAEAQKNTTQDDTKAAAELPPASFATGSLRARLARAACSSTADSVVSGQARVDAVAAAQVL